MSEQNDLMVRDEVDLDRLRGVLLRDIERVLTMLGDFHKRLEDDGPDASLYGAALVRILGAAIDKNCSRFLGIANRLKDLRREVEPAIDVKEEDLEPEDVDLGMHVNLIDEAQRGLLRFDLLRFPDDHE